MIRRRRSTRTKITVRPLTAKRQREVAALESLPDDTIDYSDIPSLKDEFWKRAVRNPFYGRLFSKD